MNNRNTARIVLDYIGRNTIATDRFLPIGDRDRAMVTLERLLDSQRISQWTHNSGLRYWTRPSGRPLSDRSLVRSLGILSFCDQVASRSVLTRNDMRHYFPQLVRYGLPAGYYFERDVCFPRLGHVRVDSSSRISRIVARTFKIIDQHRLHPGFRELIDGDRFDLTWIVATPAKQRRLTQALRSVAASGVCPHVCSIPALIDLLAPLPPT
jgi:hypothetical protein